MRRALALIALAAAAACHSGGSNDPIIDSFTADINPLSPGSPETLRWTVRNATGLSIDQGVGDVTGKTSTTVSPTVDTTYTLRAVNSARPSGVVKTVSVRLASNPAIVWFTAVPSQVLSGTSVTYSWSVSGGAGVLFDGAPVSGTSLVQVARTTATHTLSLAGSAGSPQAHVVVRVVVPPSISSFTASPLAIGQGASSALSWSGNGLSYSLSDGTQTTALGAETHAIVSPSATTTYTLTAQGPAGTQTTQTQTVTVTPAGSVRSLAYTNPSSTPAGAALSLMQNAASTPGKLVLDVVTTQAVQANALAFGIALDGTKVVLDAAAGGDVSPGFTVNTAALNPGTAPVAARASLVTTGPLANVLTFGVAQKPSGSGAVAGDATLAPGTVICTLRLVPAPSSGPGPVFPLAADPANPVVSDAYKPYKARLRGTTTESTVVALGSLTLN